MSTQVLNLLFSMVTTQFNLPPGMINSICFVESSYRVNAIHHDDGEGDSLGVCQIKLSTAQWMGFEGTEKQLMEPNNNIYYAGKYLAHLRARYKNSNIKAIIAYNQGVTYGLTKTTYSDKVMKRWKLNGYKESAKRKCGPKSCPIRR